MANNLEGVIYIRAKLQQPDIITVKNGLSLFFSHRKLGKIGVFICREFSAAFGVVQ